MIIFSTYDRVAETYSNPVVAPSFAFAGREVQVMIQQHPESMMAQSPDDFYLCALGEYDPASKNDQPLIVYDKIKKIPVTSFMLDKKEGEENGSN